MLSFVNCAQVSSPRVPKKSATSISTDGVAKNLMTSSTKLPMSVSDYTAKLARLSSAFEECVSMLDGVMDVRQSIAVSTTDAAAADTSGMFNNSLSIFIGLNLFSASQF